MKLYIKALKMHIMSELQYKGSFFMSIISQIITFFSYYFVIISLFTKFNNIKGFSLYEVLLCFSIIQFGFAFNEVFARGIDKFDNFIISGKFDQLLLRPKNIILQVLISETDFVKIARLIQSLIVMVIALINLRLEITLLKIFTLILMFISAIIIFFCLFLISASYCFLTVQGLEVRNVLTDGGKQMAQYPIGIFNKGFIFVFTFIVPYAFVNYYPLLYFLGRNNNTIYAFSPLIVFIYLIPCILLFNLGTKKYKSVGS
ncbi:MAG: ABC-2 family transporter protein [Erysipelotrichales bacterium]|nr:ABC-2 family transporter protein [Erysipelotrichales bacterium]